MSSRRPASQLASHVSPLLSTRPSDSGLHVHLHPIVLLTITDHLTRYVARGFNSQPNPPPIIGALLGRQGGELARDTTLEQGFECKVVQDAAGAWTLDTEWFEVRLQQFRDVHKTPALDLMGWWTVSDSDLHNDKGPRLEYLPFHQHMLQYNKNAVLLVFHAAAVARSLTAPPSENPQTGEEPMQDLTSEESTSNAAASPEPGSQQRPEQQQQKQQQSQEADDDGAAMSEQLPLTIYETVYEEDHTTPVNDGSTNIESTSQKFRVLPYSLATQEVEMIGVSTIVKTAGTASAIPNAHEGGDASDWRPPKENKTTEVSDSVPLTRAEDDLLRNLKTRLNALKTLDTRLRIVERYLASLSSSDLTQTGCRDHQKHLRNVYSLITHLSLIQPPEKASYDRDTEAQRNDVEMGKALCLMNKSISEMREAGKKFAGLSQAMGVGR